MLVNTRSPNSVTIFLGSKEEIWAFKNIVAMAESKLAEIKKKDKEDLMFHQQVWKDIEGIDKILPALKREFEREVCRDGYKCENCGECVLTRLKVLEKRVTELKEKQHYITYRKIRSSCCRSAHLIYDIGQKHTFCSRCSKIQFPGKPIGYEE